MPTTIMKDSIVGDEWIKEMCIRNPIQRVLNEQGQPTTNIRTCPVRLSFCDALFTAKPRMKSDPNSKPGFYTTILFPPGVDFAPIMEDINKVLQSDFAGKWNGQEYVGLKYPLKDQREKSNLGGYTPGCFFANISTNIKPAIVDVQGNPIVDETQIYAGAWVLASVNIYVSGKGTPNHGPRIGLQSIMKVADDKPLAGGSVDPKTQFKGVQVQPPVTVPSASFGRPSVAPPGIMTPGQASVGAYYPGAPMSDIDPELAQFS